MSNKDWICCIFLTFIFYIIGLILEECAIWLDTPQWVLWVGFFGVLFMINEQLEHVKKEHN